MAYDSSLSTKADIYFAGFKEGGMNYCRPSYSRCETKQDEDDFLMGFLDGLPKERNREILI